MQHDYEIDPSCPYWALDAPFCTLNWQGEILTVRMKGHRSTERYSEPAAINPLGIPAGDRVYFSIHPYIAAPDWRIRIAHPPILQASLDNNDASVLMDAVRWTARHEHWIGYGQAWYYPAARTIVLWELLPYERLLPRNPFADNLLPTLWRAFERVLAAQVPEAEHIMTPAWEPAYDEDIWQDFLLTLGYLPDSTDDLAFTKTLSIAR